MNRIKLILIGLTLFVESFAQSNLTLYHMRSLPQTMHVNPANTPDTRFFIGFPGMSSFYSEVNVVGVNPGVLDAALVPDPSDGNSYQLDITRLGSILDNRAYTHLDINYDLVHFGFFVGKNLITFNATEKVKTRLEVPGDLIKLAVEGNGGDNLGRSFALNAAIDLRHTREFAFGYQRSFLYDHLRVGARVKYIYGVNAIQTKRNSLYFRTDEDDYTMTVGSDLEVNAASSIFTLDENFNADPRKALYGARNDGFGLDLGASLDFTPKLTLSASIIDLGFVRWKQNTFNIKSANPNAQFEFRGLDGSQFFSDSISMEQAFRELGDSILDVFYLDTSRNTFTTGLFTEFYFGGSYQLSKRHALGALISGSFYNGTIYPAATFSYNGRISPMLSVSVSYTAQKRNLGNLGYGMSLNFKSFQYYVVSDNALGIFTGDIRNIGFRTGINFTFKRTIREDLDWDDRYIREQIDPPTEDY